MTLRTRTSLLMAVILSLGLAVSGLGFLQFLEKSLRQSISNGVQSLAVSTSEVINKYLKHGLADTRAVAAMLPTRALVEQDVAEIENYLEKMLGIYPEFRGGMFLLDGSGKLWADYPPHEDIRGRNFSFREYFPKTIATGTGVVGGPYLSARNQEPVLTFTAYLRGPEGEPLGLLGCSVSLASPEALGGLREHPFGKTGYLYVYDTTRLMILHPQKERMLQRDVPHGANPLFDAAINGFEGVGETVNSRGVPMLLALKQVPDSNWIVGAQQTIEEAFAPIREARIKIFFLVLGGALTAALIGAMAIKKVTFPLEQLRRVALQMDDQAKAIQRREEVAKIDFRRVLGAIGSGDEISHLAGTFSDLYKRLEATWDSLQNAAADWRQTFDSVRDPILILNRDARIRRLNDSAADLLRIEPGKATGRSVSELVPELSGDLLTSGLARFDALEIELFGRMFEVSSSLLPESGAGGLGTVLIFKDITRRKKNDKELAAARDDLEVRVRERTAELETANQRLTEEVAVRQRAETELKKALLETAASRDRIDAILQSAADGMIVTDVDNRIVLINRAAEELLGISAEQALKVGMKGCISTKPLLERLNGALSRKSDETLGDYEFPDREPHLHRTLQVKTSVIRGTSGEIGGMISTFHDVTREREIDRMKSEFISTAAHELRTPLTAVLGYTELLLAGEVETAEERKHFLTHIFLKAGDLARLVDDLLSLSRIESGMLIQIDRQPHDLAALVRQLADQYQELTTRHHFAVQVPEEGLLAVFDRGKIGQVLENLISNAVKYSPAGGSVQVRGESVDGVCRVIVRDEGIGMTAEQVSKVFDKFYRADASNTAVQGLGLGMSIVKRIIEAHGGRIRVDSEVKKGTTVTFSLPQS